VIRYEWRTELTGDEFAAVRSLLEAAADYDAEPEFSSIDAVDVERDLAQHDPSRQLLLIWMLPRQTQIGEDEEPETLAGVLRMVVDRQGVGDVQLVIAPTLRSLGIVTLFVERAGLDVAADGGWLGSGATALRSWAQGNHPAAGRLSDRHLIPRTKRVWKLIRPVDDPWDESLPVARVRVVDDGTDAQTLAALRDFTERAASAAVPCPGLVADLGHDAKTVLVATLDDGRIVGALGLNRQPVLSEEFGKCAVAEYVSRDADDDPALTRALLVRAFVAAADSGLEGVIVHVDSENAGLVNACRLTRFQHDRTDVRFEL
jgi:mycothiol synthase